MTRAAGAENATTDEDAYRRYGHEADPVNESLKRRSSQERRYEPHNLHAHKICCICQHHSRLALTTEPCDQPRPRLWPTARPENPRPVDIIRFYMTLNGGRPPRLEFLSASDGPLCGPLCVDCRPAKCYSSAAFPQTYLEKEGGHCLEEDM